MKKYKIIQFGGNFIGQNKSPQKKKKNIFSTTLAVSLVICILDTYSIQEFLLDSVKKLVIHFNQTSEPNSKL